MATTYPITLDTANIKSIRFEPKTAVAQDNSLFTGQQKTYVYSKQMWVISVELAAKTRADAEAVLCQLLSLNGAQGTFYIGDPIYTTARGIATGEPVIKGAGQTGNTLITDGWTTSQTGILKAGDWLQVGTGSTRQLVKVVADADSDGAGDATLEIWPRIRTAFADNTSLVVSSPTGIWRMQGAMPSWELNSDRIYSGISFTASESF